MIAHHLSHQQVLERLCEQVRFARRRFGHDEVIDFLAVLFGYAIGTAPHGGGQFGQLSHSLESMGDSPSPSLEYIWSSPFSPFQTARIVLALHGFVFLLVICLLLASFAALASLLVPSSTFLLTRKGQAHDAPSSPEAPLPRRWPRLSSRIHCLVEWRACGCRVPGAR